MGRAQQRSRLGVGGQTRAERRRAVSMRTHVVQPYTLRIRLGGRRREERWVRAT